MVDTGLKTWRTFVGEYPELVKYFAYDFPQGGTWKEFVEWRENVFNDVRGDPMNPQWLEFVPGPFPHVPLDFAFKALRRFAYKILRYAIYTKVEFNPNSRYDLYVFPDSYAFVLPHNPYGWGILFAQTAGVGYFVTRRLVNVRIPVQVVIAPDQILHRVMSPFYIAFGGHPYLNLWNVPTSKNYKPWTDFVKTGAFLIRPFSVEPDGGVFIGSKVSEQWLKLGKLGKEVFFEPEFIPVFRILFKLADLSAYLSRKVFEDLYIGDHKEYNAFARIDYAMTMFHTLLLADFPAYRSLIERWYSKSERPKTPPLPAHSLVIKVSGNAAQLSSVMAALPMYVGSSWFPELDDLFRMSMHYKRLVDK